MAASSSNNAGRRPVNTTRKLKQPKRGRKVKTHLKVNRKPIPRAWRLLAGSISHLLRNWRLYLGITIIYFILTMALVRGFGGLNDNIVSLKSLLTQSFHGKTGSVSTGLTLFGVLLNSVGNTNSDVASAYQTMLLVVFSLAIIWALRQTHSETAARRIEIRDAFYKGLYPLAPLLLVLVVIAVQLIPAIIAGTIYNLVFGSHFAVNWYEQWAWGIGLGLLAFWSIFMVSSSVFALYIVTLPDVRPMQALRSAHQLVRYRRWVVLLKVVFLPLAVVALSAAIIVPLIFIWATGVEWVFLVLTMFSLVIIHSYMYSLYRSLI